VEPTTRLMVPLRHAIAILLCLSPGLLAYLWGRKLVPFKEDPAFAERYLIRSKQIYMVAFIALIASPFVATLPWPVYPLVTVLAALTGGFSARKKLFDEEWDSGSS
jgi:hypothetical protein